MQEVIIYRNPAEAAIWHAIMESPLGFLSIVVTCIVFVLTMVLIDGLVGKFKQTRSLKYTSWWIWVHGAISAGAAAVVFTLMNA